jgi:hypothetical protein
VKKKDYGWNKAISRVKIGFIKIIVDKKDRLK